ncbi:anti-sigma factor domain-containing protein [Paenibacillus soyae]|uniref:Anti-sigma factor n=1 Tax=Paenibacillus soyae TaxID=2969249 RepID=A0A9X2MLU1_9BACL|nr:anti-sigma factor [Paenibacillus soyae]MCR2802600.1 anti-sigma factor [Paenibacillus soyae]
MKREWSKPGDVSRSCEAGYAEQHWIDLALGRTDRSRQATLLNHLDVCGHCRAAHDEWSKLLIADAAGACGMEEPLELPAKRRSSLERQVRRIRAGKRLKKSLLAGASAAAAAVMIAVALLNRGPVVEPDTHLISYVEQMEPAALRMMQAADTSRYSILPQGNRQESGFLWLSGDSKEAFLILEHLNGRANSDYQAWAVQGTRSDSLGLVKLSEDRGYLHIKADILPAAENIALSAEPQGGSLRPTTRQIVLLMLPKR